MSRLHHSHYILSSFLSCYPELVAQRGGNLQQLTKAAGLPVECFEARHQLILFEQFIDLLEETARRLSYPEVALDLAGKQSTNVLGPLLPLLDGCQTFGDGIDRILQHLSVLLSGFTSVPSVVDKTLLLSFEVNFPKVASGRQFQYYMLASTVSVIRSLTQKRFPVRSCYFAREEPDASIQKKLTTYFEPPVGFGHHTLGLAFNSVILEEPIDVDIKQKTFTRPNFNQSRHDLQNQLSEAIAAYLPTGDVSLARVAAAFGYTKPTFRRRLESASISFSATLAAVRLSLANQYLHSTQYSLGDIAALLGYSNQGAFTRSYRRWSGLNPSDYRASLSEP